jgi:hypothetical protein
LRAEGFVTNGEWLRNLILRGRSIEELTPFQRSMLANLERDSTAESKRPDPSEIHVTVHTELAERAPRGTSSAPCPPES